VSLVPVFFGLGWIYFAAAGAGGAFFLWKCAALVAAPGRKTALASFFASLVQLCCVLFGAMLDVALG
jgi:protoheme IX farnesyltransferase